MLPRCVCASKYSRGSRKISSCVTVHATDATGNASVTSHSNCDHSCALAGGIWFMTRAGLAAVSRAEWSAADRAGERVRCPGHWECWGAHWAEAPAVPADQERWAESAKSWREAWSLLTKCGPAAPASVCTR